MKKKNLQKIPYAFVLILPALLFASCGPRCSPGSGDNISGRIKYMDKAGFHKDSTVRVEWSLDKFSTPPRSEYERLTNESGLLTFGYKTCVPYGKSFSLRAYEDLNQNGQLDSGEPNGRYDDTETGNASFIERQIATPPPDFFDNKKNDSPDAAAYRIDGLDISIDSDSP